MPSAPSWPATRASADSPPQGARSFTMRLDLADDMRPTPSPRPENPGDLPLLPGYELLREVGRGGMGVVYQARQLGVNRMVAVKMVLAGRFASAEELLRFRLEAEMAARVRHPNVVQVHEVGLFDELPYLVLEWVEGGTLHALMRRRSLPHAECAQLIAALAGAVHAAHLQGVIHRDLKPGNILLSPESLVLSPEKERASLRTQDSGLRTSVPKIADFGLAKLLDRPQGITAAGIAVGTPEYMAPEQARGGAVQVGPPADIYALGAILYHLLAGLPPHNGNSTVDTLVLLQTEEPKPIRRRAPDVPPDLETICLKCLRKDPAERYPSAQALADDLERFLQRRPIEARPVGRIERARLWVRRNPLVAALALLLFVLSVGGVAGLAFLYQEADEQRAVFARQRDAAIAHFQRAEKAEAAAKRAQAEAQAKAAEAGAVSRFLVQGVLKGVEPDQANERVVTMEDMLDFAAAKIDAAFAKQPNLGAEMRLHFGDAYDTLGRYAKAKEQYEKSYALFRERFGDDHADTLAAQYEIGRCQNTLGEHVAALKTLQDCLDRCVKAFGAEGRETIKVRIRFATCLGENGRIAEAEKLLEGAAAHRERTLGPNHDLTLSARAELSGLLLGAGKTKTALALMEETLKRRREAAEPDEAKIGALLVDLASAYDRQKRYQEANALHQERIAFVEKRRGPRHPEMVTCLNNLGASYIRQKRDAEAEKVLRRAWDLAQEILGPDSLGLIRTQYNLACSLLHQKSYEEAEKLFTDNLSRCRRSKVQDSEDSQLTLNRLGQLHEELKDDEKARAYYQETLASRLRSQGLTELTAASYLDLARALDRLGEHDQIRKLAEEAASQAAKLPPERCLHAAAGYAFAGRAAMPFGPPDRTEKWLREALRIRLEKLRPEAPYRLQSHGLLGQFLLKEKRYAEAEPHLLEAARGYATFSPGGAVPLRSTQRMLADLYEAWGKPEEAKKWREKKVDDAK